MLRRKQTDIALLDDVDRTLLSGVEQGLTWRALLASCRCDEEETQLRILRLIHTGHLEGKLGEDSERVAARAEAPVSEREQHTVRPPARDQNTVRPSAARATPAPSSSGSRPAPRASSGSGAPTTPSTAPGTGAARTVPAPASAQSTAPGAKTVPPNARAAHEALLRELATRRVTTTVPPVRPSEPAAKTASAPGYYCVRPEDGGPAGTDSGRPIAPELEQVRRGTTEFPSRADPRVSSAPPGRYSLRGEQPTSVASSAPPAGAQVGFESPLAALIDEFSRGQERERQCARLLGAALHEELSGNVQRAIEILHELTVQLNDARIRAERDRLQALTAKASSGIYRAHALKAERAAKHKEAAESWRKVLEACPDDAEAALHVASCSMELGDLKRAGTYARRAAELAPESVAAHRLLWRFFRKTGMEHNANREREILRKLSKGAG